MEKFSKITNAGDINSSYIKYIYGVPVEFPPNEARVEIWLHENGQPIGLLDAIKSENSDALPEHSQQLLVDGDLVTLPWVDAGSPRRTL